MRSLFHGVPSSESQNPESRNFTGLSRTTQKLIWDTKSIETIDPESMGTCLGECQWEHGVRNMGRGLREIVPMLEYRNKAKYCLAWHGVGRKFCSNRQTVASHKTFSPILSRNHDDEVVEIIVSWSVYSTGSLFFRDRDEILAVAVDGVIIINSHRIFSDRTGSAGNSDPGVEWFRWTFRLRFHMRECSKVTGTSKLFCRSKISSEIWPREVFSCFIFS